MGPGPGGAGGPFVGFQDIMDAFFGTAAGGVRGPRPRTRPGSDAILPLPLELHETAFGVEAPVTVDTAVLCQTCHGGGTAPGTHVATCEVCGGRGGGQSAPPTLPRPGGPSRPPGARPGLRNGNPHPGPALGAARPGPPRAPPTRA